VESRRRRALILGGNRRVELVRVLRLVTLLVDGSMTRSNGRCSRSMTTGGWLSGDEQHRAVKS
jgi:hypothetical protein